RCRECRRTLAPRQRDRGDYIVLKPPLVHGNGRARSSGRLMASVYPGTCRDREANAILGPSKLLVTSSSAAGRSPKWWIARLSSRCVLAISSKVLERRNRIASNAPISIQFSNRLIVSKLICPSLRLGPRKAQPFGRSA